MKALLIAILISSFAFVAPASQFGVGSRLVLQEKLELEAGDFYNLKPYDYGASVECGLWVQEIAFHNREIQPGTVFIVHKSSKASTSGGTWRYRGHSNVAMHIEGDPGIPERHLPYTLELTVNCNTTKETDFPSQALKLLPDLLQSVGFYPEYLKIP